MYTRRLHAHNVDMIRQAQRASNAPMKPKAAGIAVAIAAPPVLTLELELAAAAEPGPDAELAAEVFSDVADASSGLVLVFVVLLEESRIEEAEWWVPDTCVNPEAAVRDDAVAASEAETNAGTGEGLFVLTEVSSEDESDLCGRDELAVAVAPVAEG